MIKLIGSLMVVASTAAIGLSSVIRMRTRVGMIADIITALENMKSEICSSLSPMRDVMEKMCDTAPRRVRPLFHAVCGKMCRIGDESFAAIWKSAACETCRILTEDERGTLSDVGLSLGKYDVEWQAQSIERAVRRFEVFLKNAETVRDRESKIHAFLGIAAGIFAVIVFI